MFTSGDPGCGFIGWAGPDAPGTQVSVTGKVRSEPEVRNIERGMHLARMEVRMNAEPGGSYAYVGIQTREKARIQKFHRRFGVAEDFGGRREKEC